MSMNIHFDMVQHAIQISRIPDKNGKKGKVIRKKVKNVHCLPVWQTPTEVTNYILTSTNPVQEYFDWVRTKSNMHYEPQYAEDDFLCENEPIGFIPVDYAHEHIQEFTEQMKIFEDEGYTLEVYMM